MMRQIALILFIQLFLTPFGALAIDYQKVWTSIHLTDDENVLMLIKELSKSERGRRLLAKAREKVALEGNTLLDTIQVGKVSLTDTTVVRRFKRLHPEHVTYATKSKVFINKNLPLSEAILDLAHELTHFLDREEFNPYLYNNGGVKKFISRTIEGTGGEVEAFITECEVLKDLAPRRLQQRENCMSLWDFEKGHFSKHLGVKEFYKVGDYFEDFTRHVSLSTLGDSEPRFISSAYGVPYPIAAYYEYQNMMKKVCENDFKRLEIFKQQQSRRPASIQETRLLEQKSKTISLHCSDFLDFT